MAALIADGWSTLLIWVGLCLLGAGAILLVAAIDSEPLKDDEEPDLGEPVRHKSPPRYTQDDWL